MSLRRTLLCSLARAELPLVLAVSPALLFPSPLRLVLVAVVPVAWLAHRLTSGAWLPRTPLDPALWCIAGTVAMSAWVTPDLQFSLGKISGVVLGMLVFWASVRWVDSPRRLVAATGVFILAGGGLSVIGLLGTNWLDKFPVIGSLTALLPPAIRGVPGAETGFNPNAVAGCLVLFVPVQIALLASPEARAGLRTHLRPTWGRWLGPAQEGLLALTAGTLLLTQSRGALASLVVGLAVLAACHGPRGRRVAVLGAAGTVVLIAAVGPANLARHTLNQEGSGIVGTLGSRFELWSRALMALTDFPFTGVGMNGFRRIVPVLYPTLTIPPGTDVVHAHNHLLQAALDLGAAGLVAYLAIWIVIARLLLEVRRDAGEGLHRSLAVGLAAGLFTHFLFGMTDAIPLGAKVGVLFWLTLALAVALHGVSRVGAVPRGRSHSL